MDLLFSRLFLLLLNFFGPSDVAEVKFDAQMDPHWENFKKTYQKSYVAQDEVMRRLNFEANFKLIMEHNERFEQGIHSFNLGFNEFADMMIEDFVRMLNGLLPKDINSPIPFIVPADANIPDSIDWRDKGAVTPVKNQGNCGACYAFSATGSLEGQDFLRHGKLISLSEQNIIDCSRKQGNQGCSGGVMDYAFEYVEDTGLDSEESYPYKDKEGPCLFKRRTEITSCYGYSDIDEGDEAALKAAVGLVGPISIGIDASHESFQLYRGGIYDEPACSSTKLDHGVLAVGYGTENGTDYWIVKNSWGTSWGENGYIRMSRNKNNQCGIASQASFPIL